MATLFSYFKKSDKSKRQQPTVKREEISLNNFHALKENNFIGGELVWAKLSDYPWWPAMVCDDPKSKATISKKFHKVHVQFFGQPPTHDWVKESDIVEFGTRHLQGDDEELKAAFEEATAASKLPTAERVKTYYACVSDEDENNCAEEESEEENNNKENFSRKRSNSQARNKPRKRIKLSIESDDDHEDDIDDEDDDVSYEPGKDTVSEEEEENYRSDASESEEEIPKKRKKMSPNILKTPKNSVRKSATITPTTRKSVTSTPTSLNRTPNSSKLNDSISKAQSNLLQFSSPTVSVSPSRVSENEELQFTHSQLKFIQDGYRKDKHGRLHTDPNYDPTTLLIPDSYVNSKEVSPGMRQWWQLKRELYDTIIFFKVGKFYELYHMDATIGVKELGLIYMKGKFAHCGFPEIAFSRYSEVLVQRGYKVARVEQTETPQAMNARGGAKVVNREVCAVISKGTRTFNFMEGQSDGDASNYLLAFVEKSCNDVTLGGSVFGVCFVDTSIGRFYLGQFKDDRQCSRFLTMISQYPPVQILYDRHGLSSKVQHILNHELLAAIKEPLAPNSEFWNASKTLKHFHENKYFVDEIKPENDGEWPPVLRGMLADGDSLGMEASDEYKLAISSLGACTWYLKKCCIDVELLSMAQFEEYVPSDNVLKRKVVSSDVPKFMILDGVTLTNLDIVINTNGGTEGTLLELLDHCATPFGKRYFKQWLCAPSCSKQAIDIRLNAVEDLMAAFSCMSEVRSIMQTMPDLERILRRVHALGSLRRSKDHPDARAIFYNDETYSKKKIADLLAVLEGFSKAACVISSLQDKQNQWSSTWLKSLLLKTGENETGKFPDLQSTLNFFKSAFDHKKAKETGTIHPKQGVLREYDDALHDINEIKEQLDLHLKQQRKRLGCSNIVYWGTGKNRYQLQIPESVLRSSTPNDYHLKSQKKGYKRFSNRHIDELNERLTNAEERRDDALKDTMRNIFHKFDSHYAMWEKAVKCLAVLDCLMSLAFYSKNIDGVSCRPEIFDTVDEQGSEIQPFVELLNCRHPCINQQSLNGGDFIPNDIVLGKNRESSAGSPCCVLITGPNMGGKSTLMRQAGVLLIMAQLGCYVPAEVCRFTAVDRVFTRLGARDRILHGESTFYVELSETATIFQHATKHSLVLLDELGRGTATYDGTAIASAVVNDLANRLQCRTLFSTHYHSLVEEFSQNQHIKLGHMACMVEKDVDDEDDPTNETITFLYKFTGGACPKSYGFNAAKLAGLPLSIIKSAHKKAKSFELSSKNSRMFRDLMKTSGELRERMAILNGDSVDKL